MISRRRARLCWLAAGLLILLAAACGGSGGNNDGGTTPPPVTGVTITPKTVTISRGATQQFSAVVSGSSDQSIQWRVNGTEGGDAIHGLISKGGVYIAPTSVPVPPTVTVTAVSFADATKSDSATVTIQTGSSVSVVIAGAGSPVSVLTFGSHVFSATVTGTSNTALIWRVNGVTGGSAVTGTITQSGVYDAPHSVPVSSGPNNADETTDVIVTAVSQADPTASDSAIAVPVPAQRGHFPEPIPLGTSGGNAKDSSVSGSVTYCCAGTLGSLVARSGRLFILSNNHVLARSDLGVVGDAIIQPGLVENNCSPAGANVVASLSEFFNLETGPVPNVDAAIAEITSGAVELLGTILQLGGTTNGDQPTDGTPNPGPGVLPTIARQVAKSGSATGLTCAPILAINASISVEYQKGCNTGTTYTVNFVRQVDIGGTGFSAMGDSGSLVVTQDTADPVGLLFSGSDTDTLANPLAAVFSQLADPNSGEKPVFVGDSSVGPHPVAACTIPQPSPAQVLRVEGSAQATSTATLQAATSARDAHAAELMAHPEVQALGVGASYDSPGEAAILLFVTRGQARSDLPPQVDGIRTRLVVADVLAKRGSLSTVESYALEQSAAPPRLVYPVREADVERAIKIQSDREEAFMQRRGVQGVGVTSSVDSPGEVALMVFVIRGVERDPIPAVIDGLRTRIRESSRFRAR
jgi:hypothetical protein